MKAGGRQAPQPNRTAGWNIVVSILVCLLVIVTMPFLVGGSDVQVQVGRLASVVALVVILKWGYWRRRR